MLLTLNDKEIWVPLRRICPTRDEFECHETNLNTTRRIWKPRDEFAYHETNLNATRRIWIPRDEMLRNYLKLAHDYFVPIYFVFLWSYSSNWAQASPFFEVSRSHTIRHTNTKLVRLLRTSDQHFRWSCNLRNKHKRRTLLPSAGFEPTISTIECPQTYALDLMATETGSFHLTVHFFFPATDFMSHKFWPTLSFVK
jgi:hypothetical protein